MIPAPAAVDKNTRNAVGNKQEVFWRCWANCRKPLMNRANLSRI